MRVALFGKTVECSGSDVEIAVGGGEDEKENTGIDKSGETLDTTFDNGHDEGGCRGAGALLGGECERLAVVRDQSSNE